MRDFKVFIAHLPAGYLLGKACASVAKTVNAKLVVLSISIGSILPDADMLYFYLIDNQSTHHRHYITHWPLFWLAIISLSLLFLRQNRNIALTGLGLGSGGLLHMVLDSVAAPVFWLAPFSNAAIELVVIPAIYDNYIWSFLLHWTFALEIIICITAAFLVWRSHQKQNTLIGDRPQ